MFTLDAVAAEACALYDTYLATVVPLFAGESADLASLVALFAAPTTAVLPDACLVLPDQAALARRVPLRRRRGDHLAEQLVHPGSSSSRVIRNRAYRSVSVRWSRTLR